jgi:hypothetical protein
MIQHYLARINEKLAHGDATEHTHRPALEELLKALSKDSVVTNEPKKTAVGAPDFVIRRKIGKTQWLPVGYLETKPVGTDLDEIEKTDQIKRYKTLGNLVLTNYAEFRWYVDGKLRGKAVLARHEKGRLKLRREGEEEAKGLLKGFLEHEPLPISSPQELAKKMAALSRHIDRIIVEAFKRTLLPDLTPEQFADMFAQTLAYGLFAARINHFREAQQQTPPNPPAGGGEFRRSEAAREIPKTNPFLRRLFDTINGADIEDEPFIGFVDDLTAVMHHADIGAILQHFGRRTGQEDPVVHFYETFLAAYDPKLRELRGVYFTPEPVVSYIVRSVDILLKEKFGLKDGLADRSTVEVEVEESGRKVKKRLPKVLILDPACGTGTFLYAVIDLIRRRFMESGNAGEWSDFVREHLLPRIYGFELLMAPYAVAHLKLAMQLSGQDLDEPLRSQWAYDFRSEERLNIYLTNSLEMTDRAVQTALFGLEKQIAEEANAARSIKADLPIMVVLGNPPYANYGRLNRSGWIVSLIEDYKVGLKEKKLNLDDDYVKFIRFGQWRVQRSGCGVLAYISNNSYTDGVTHRRMRESLIDTFDSIWVLDLHGSVKRRERAPDGSKDENVFDIQQGVSIGIFAGLIGKGAPKSIRHSEVWGLREAKYMYLNGHDVENTVWQDADAREPDFFFVPKHFSREAEYRLGFGIHDIFRLSQNGVKTDRDGLFVDMVRRELAARMQAFYSEEGLSVEFVKRYRVENSSSYDLLTRRRQTVFDSTNIVEYQYRPLDMQFLYYTIGLTSRPAQRIAQHMIRRRNIGLVTGRQGQVMGSGTWDLAFCSRHVADTNLFYRGGNSICPLYLYDKRKQGSVSASRQPNLSPTFVEEFSRKLGLGFVEDGRGDLGLAEVGQTPPNPPVNGGGSSKRSAASSRHGKQTSLVSPRKQGETSAGTFGPEDVFDYIYAVFHSPTYRTRYAEFLKIDFPRVPLTSNVELFRKLVKLGGRLVKLHLLEFDPETPPYPPAGRGASESPSVHGGTEGGWPLRISYPVRGDHTVEKVRYVDTKRQVWINKTQYFEGVPPEVWEFHIGGYQVAEKWLKDRKGRTLSSEEREHYRKIIAALHETILLMQEIDRAIPKWPME